MTKQANFKIAALTALIALGGTAAFAKGDHAKMFGQIDADGNGQVTQEEMRAHARARFDAADSDSDGFLSPEEMTAARAARHEGKGGGHDGKKGKRAERMLEKFDTNKDGALDAAELEAAHAERGNKRAERMMKRMDANNDGKIAFEEMGGGRDPAKMFEKLDADGNGTLSAEEFAEARKGGGKGKRHHGKHDQD